jgi:hypothetical protein
MDITRDTGIQGGALPKTGIDKLAAAKTAPPGTPGAPRTAPQGGSPNALPPTPQMTSAAQPESAMDRYARMLEAQGEDSAKARKDAKAMAIIQAGLGIAGGTSPNAFANIAQGALPAIQSYQQALQGLRKDDRERIGKLMEMGLGKEKLAMELRKLGIEEKRVGALVNFYNARAGAAGSGGGVDKQARLFAFNAGRDLTKVTADVAKLKNTDEYKQADSILRMPYDPKKATPAMKQMRERAQSVINSINQEATNRIEDARSAVEFYRSEAGMPPLAQASGAGGNMPKGIPPGSKQVGTSGGKPVYESPDGKRYIVE